MEPKTVNRHLTDAELFNLAVPPVGEPEALPRHLSECWSCSRALQEWKSAVRELADEETETSIGDHPRSGRLWRKRRSRP